MVCSVGRCGGKCRARGYCSKHYQRFQRHGDPLVVLISRAPGTPSERFDVKWTLDEATGCHDWTGGLNRGAYGQFRLEGETVSAHRFAWERVNGPIPDGMYIDHICRNRACVNVQHLRVVTPRVNALENSLGVSAVNARKTRCLRGHPLAGENLYVGPNGGRECRECRRAADRRRRLRQSVEVDPYGQLLLAVG